MALIAGTAVLGVLLLARFAPRLWILAPDRRPRFLRTPAGNEARIGATTLALGVLAPVAAACIALTDWAPGLRLAIIAGLLGLSVTAASDQWTRVPLRILGAAGLGIVLMLLIAVGQAAIARATADQAMSELARTETSLDGLTTVAEERLAELTDSQAAAIAKVRAGAQALADEEPAVADSAGDLLTKLEDPAASQEELLTALGEFESSIPQATLGPQGQQLGADVQAAFDAVSSVRMAATDEGVWAALRAACRTAVQRSEESRPECPGPATGEPLTVQMSVVRLRLAEYHRDLFGRAEDTSAVAEAELALTDARAAVGANLDPVSVVTAVEAGADDIMDSLFEGEPPVELGWLIWLLIGIGSLLAWRQVERRSARQEAGPVSPVFTSAADPESAPCAEAKQLFRTALLTNLNEPSVMPGQTSGAPLNDLIELAAIGPDWLSKALSALKAVFSERHGYSIDAHQIPHGDGPGEGRVLVRVSEVDTGRQVAVDTIRGEDDAAASRGAGFWAAAAVLRRSTRIPSWASWSEGSYEALAGFEEGKGAASDLEELRRAVAHDPTSGVLLLKLANLLDTKAEHIEALGFYARAVAAHPRYMRARYRLAVSIGGLHLAPDKWQKLETWERLRIGEEVARACASIPGFDYTPPTPGVAARNASPIAAALAADDPDTCKKALLGLTPVLYDCLIDDLDHKRLLNRLWARSERAHLSRSIRDVLDPYGSWAQAKWVAQSARAVALRQPKDITVQDLRNRAEDPLSSWQLSYNLACYYARGEDKEDTEGARDNALEGVRWLETALSRPNSGKMGEPWLTVDPDLKPLLKHADSRDRFLAVVAALLVSDSNGS